VVDETVYQTIEEYLFYELFPNFLGYYNQHSFNKNQSTVSNLIQYSCCVLNAVKDRCQVDYVYTSFSKAFDRIRDCLLLDKMLAYIELARFSRDRIFLEGRSTLELVIAF
jgi:hypothetical protein